MNRTIPLLTFLLFCVATIAQKEKGTWSLKGYVPVYYGSEWTGLADGDFHLQYPRLGIEWEKKRWSHELNLGRSRKTDYLSRNNGQEFSRVEKPGMSWSYEMKYRLWKSKSESWQIKGGIGLLSNRYHLTVDQNLPQMGAFGFKYQIISASLGVLVELKYAINSRWGIVLSPHMPLVGATFIGMHKQTYGDTISFSNSLFFHQSLDFLIIRPGVSYRF